MRFFAVLLFIPLGAFCSPDPIATGERLYQQTDYKASIAAVGENNNRASAAAAGLVGRDYYMLGDFKKASEAFQKAFTLEPTNSELAHWLAKSFGRRAETSSPFTAPTYAAQARTYFEKAVALDPKNQEALSDLFDYYLEAPGFLGGGYDKAEGIAHRIAEQNPAEGHFAEARLAERRKDFDTAGEQLRRAVQVAPHEVGRILDLARYLGRRGRIPESEAVFDKAEKLAPNSPIVAFARARLYVEQKRNLDQAKSLLQQYLRSNLTPNDPSRAQAEKLLKEANGA
jgi:Flp pilus assembly protein TadD